MSNEAKMPTPQTLDESIDKVLEEMLYWEHHGEMHQNIIDEAHHRLKVLVLKEELSAYRNVLENAFDLSARDRLNLENHVSSLQAELAGIEEQK